MQVLSDKDNALLVKLIKLAGNDSAIVTHVLSSPFRRSVALGSVICEIEKIRDMKAQDHQAYHQFVFATDWSRNSLRTLFDILAKTDTTADDLRLAIHAAHPAGLPQNPTI